MRSYWSRVAPNPTWLVLIPEEDYVKSRTQGEHHVKMKAEIKVMLLQFKQLGRGPEYTRNWGRGLRPILQPSLRRKQPCLPIPSHLQNPETVISVVRSTQ